MGPGFAREFIGKTTQVNGKQMFAERRTIEQVEEGNELAPKFDEHGLIPAVTTDHASGELLMVGFMNAEALKRTIETGEAHYFSRSRQTLWHKGGTSGLVQKVEPTVILLNGNADYTARLIARSAVPVMEIYRQDENFEELFRRTMSGLLLRNGEIS